MEAYFFEVWVRKDVTKEGSLAWQDGGIFFEVWLICSSFLWWWIQTGVGIIVDKGRVIENESKSNASLNPKLGQPRGKNNHQNMDH